MFLNQLRRLVRGQAEQRRSPWRPVSARRGACRLELECLEGRVVPSTLLVNNTTDSPTPMPGSLRYEMNLAQPGDTIKFSSTLAGRTLDLSPQAGELLITKSLTLIGPTVSGGAPGITRSAGGGGSSAPFRVVDIEGNIRGIIVTLENLVITGGVADSGAAHFPSAGGGLMIYSPAGTVTLSNLRVTGNSATGGVSGKAGQDGAGGGIAFYAPSDGGLAPSILVLTNSTVVGNSAKGGTGGMCTGYGSGASGGPAGAGLGGGLFAFGGTVQLTPDNFNANQARGGSVHNESCWRRPGRRPGHRRRQHRFEQQHRRAKPG